MDTPQPARFRHFSNPRLLVAALVIVLIAAGILAVQYRRHPQAPALVFDSRLQNLENTVLEQEKRLAQLEANARQVAANPSPPAADAVHQPAPSAHLPPDAAATSDTSQLNDRIAALEKQLASFKAVSPLDDKDKLYHSIRLLSSFHRLSSKVLSGKPFAAELSEFEDLTGEDASLDKPIAALSPYADNGVPTFATLLASFDDAMESLKTEEATPPAGATFWQRIVYNFTHLVTIRRINEAEKGNSTGAILGRAQAHLDVQEVQGAITEITSLGDDPRSHFTSWLEDAQLAVRAPDLMDQMEENVIQKAFYTTGTADGAAGSPAEGTAPPSPPAPAGAPADAAPKAE